MILNISLHFIGDPSHLKDKNVKLLSNITCNKLSDFQWYKNTFLTRVMLRKTQTSLSWKDKFLVGLPTLLGERVRNKIKDTSSTKTIPYNQLTYGEHFSSPKKKVLRYIKILNSKNTLSRK